MMTPVLILAAGNAVGRSVESRYRSTRHTPDHELSTGGRKGAMAAAPKAISGRAQRRGGPASSTIGSSASGASFRAKPMSMTKPAAVHQLSARHSGKMATWSPAPTSWRSITIVPISARPT